MKKTLALFLVACLALTMIPFAAFAATAVTVNVELVDVNGAPVEAVNAGDSVWASVKLADYESFVGEADYTTGDVSNAIAVATTYLTLDSELTVAEENGSPVYTTLYDGIAANGGSVSYNMDGNTAKFVLETDNAAGTAYAIDKSDLDVTGGELFRVKLNVANDATGDITVALAEGDANGAASLATVTMTAGATTVGDIAIVLGAAATVSVAEPALPDVNEPGDYLVYDQINGITFDDWSAVGKSLAELVENTDTNKYVFKGNGWGSGLTVTSKLSFGLDKGDFSFSGKIKMGSYGDHAVQSYSNTPYDKAYFGVTVGDLELRFLDRNTAVLYHNGTVLKVGNSIISPRSEVNADGTYTLVDGAPVDTGVYADNKAYGTALQNAKVRGSDVIATLAVEGTEVVGYVTLGGTKTEMVRAALPSGALAGLSALAINHYGMVGFSPSATVSGAELISDKLIVTPEAVIANPSFSTDEWTIETGKSGATDTYYNAAVESNRIVTGNGSYNITNSNTYTGDKFILSYIAQKKNYDNCYATDNGAAMQIGDLYFGLNNQRMTPFVMYNGQVIYQSEKNIYEYVLTDTAIIEQLDAAGAGKNGKADLWREKYEGNNPTYTVKFDNGSFVMSYKTDNFAETEIINIDISQYVTSFTDATVAIKASIGAWSACDIFYAVNLVYSNELVDVGYLNAAAGTMTDYADYNNYPAVFKDLVVASRYAPDCVKQYITNLSVIEAYDNEYNAYHKLGSIVCASNNLVDGFQKDKWTVVEQVSQENEDGTIDTYQHIKFITNNANGYVGDYITHTGGRAISTEGTYDLSGGFHMEYNAFHQYYNTNATSAYGFWVGDLFINLDVSTAYNTYSGSAEKGQTWTGVIRVFNGETEIATSAPISMSRDSDLAESFRTLFGKDTTYIGAHYDIDYVDGVLTVTVNGTEAVSVAVDVDLSAAQLKIQSQPNWKNIHIYDFALAPIQSVNLYDFNVQLGTLADADLATYSELAAQADVIIPQLTAEQANAMYNIPVYEQYKADYEDYQANLVILNENITYNYTSGLYKAEFETELADTNYSRNETYPSGALIVPQQTTKSVTFKNPIYTDDYFVISGKSNAKYGHFYYYEYSVGELSVRVSMEDGETDVIYARVYMNGTEIYTYTTTLDQWYMSIPWTVTYDHGKLTVKNTQKNFGTVDLTALEGWDANYTPNGKNVTISANSVWGGNTILTNVSIKAKVNADAVQAFEALAATDLNAAKNIYETVNGNLDQFLTAETVAALTPDASITAEQYDGADVITLTTAPTAPIYGDEVTVTATPAEGYRILGWFDAEGNLLSEEATVTAVMEPTTNVIVKAIVDSAVCDHSDVEVRDAVDATCVTDGYEGDIWCKICETKITEGTVIPATGHTEETIVGTPATCGTAGLSDGVKCSVCGEILTEQTEIPATGEHTYGDWVIDEAAGTQTKTCTVCEDTVTEEYIPEVTEITGNWNEDGSITWTLTEDGTLTVTGTGAMADSGIGKSPVQAYADQIKTVIISDGITHVGYRAFRDMTAIETATFGKDITNVGFEVFQGCTSLKSVSLNEGLTEIGSHMFMNTALESIDFPSTIVKINNRAFRGAKLKTVAVPNTVTYVGWEAFMDNTELVSFTWSENYDVINSKDFMGCVSLTEAYIPKTVEHVKVGAFSGCTSLAVVDFEDSDTLYRISTDLPDMASDVFEGCQTTMVIKAYEGTAPQTLAIQGGFVFEKKNSTIFKYTPNADGTTCTITGIRSTSAYPSVPETIDGYTVTAIGTRAFYKNGNIVTVILPDTIETIGQQAFRNCAKLQYINIPANVTMIDWAAFMDSTALQYVTFNGTAVETINTEAFSGCTGLIQVKNLDKQTAVTIGKNAFNGCTTMASIKLSDNAVIKGTAFAGLTETLTIKCTEGSTGHTFAQNNGFAFELI